MSWIKDNKFVVALGGGTLVGAVLIFLAGSKESARYDQSKEEFDTTAGEASSFESLALYPRSENIDGKRKALAEYRQATESLQAAFAGFCPKELKNVTPQEFTNQLKSVNTQVRKALTEAGTKVPEQFFCGFENYQTSLARGNATGVLDYELEGIKGLMLALAKAGPSELRNFYRMPLGEEEGRDFAPQATEVARPLPVEITFAGTEKSLRTFLSELINQPGYYVVIRSLAVNNSKKDPPRAADAKFSLPAAAGPSAESSDVFGGGAFLLGEETKPDPKKPAPAPVAAPVAAAAGSNRILAQVLGNEEVQVFLRLDLMQFLPAKKLP
jgi:hypothetical protein